ncbi:MAG TPA: hypothetical protein VL426_03915 [Candidatus Binatia bacterium]|jgi:hypothetical protein|nr:hypothetical protein [Candidatus Binatia bacterium]
MALVVMSGVVISSVGLGSLILSSLQQTRAIDSASVAYFAAESGVEEALFTARHRDSGGHLATGQAVLPATVSTAQTLTNNATWKRTVSGRESVIYAGTIPQDSFVEVALYDPDAQTTSQDIGRVQIDWADACGGCTVLQTSLVGWQSGGPVVWDPNATTALYPWNVSGASVTLADPSRLYRLRLGAKKDAMQNVQIRAYNGAGGATTLPGRIRVDAEGSFGNVKQKLTATLPRRIPLAGIFDFVVFSECSLVKGGAISCP